MTEQEAVTVTAAATRVSQSLIRALPPAFLLLVILNIVFLGVSAWTFQHNTDRRAAMIDKILESCLQHQQ